LMANKKTQTMVIWVLNQINLLAKRASDKARYD